MFMVVRCAGCLQQQHHGKVRNRPKVYALISTLTATEAHNGMDVFSGVITKPIYICPVSLSCSPHVTSCHVVALIVVSPWLLPLCLALFPLTYSVVCVILSLSCSPHFCLSIHNAPPQFPPSLLPMIKAGDATFCLVKDKPASFLLSNPTLPQCSELFTPWWCPSVTSSSHPVRKDDTFYWKEMRAWEFCRLPILLNEHFSQGYRLRHDLCPTVSPFFSMQECGSRCRDVLEHCIIHRYWIDVSCMFS